MDVIKVILVDDHVLVRDGIKALLDDQEGVKVIDEASNGVEALAILNKNKPDLLIVDIRMPEMNGIELVKEINKKYGDIRTLVLSMHDSEEYVVQSIQSGADGYMLKGASKTEFLKALYAVASGKKYFTGDISTIIMNNFVNGSPSEVKKVEDTFSLTKREKQILEFVLQLKNNKEVAEELGISKRTAEVHRFNLMKKMEVKSLKELIDKANKYKLV